MAMPQLQFAQKAVIVDNNRILLLRKSCNDPYYPGWWDLPGGRMEDSESLDAHLIREVLVSV
jgi:ADP-ribose pyrophosphatase YjhB (NUDIX family)